jgi:alanine dehydrogenase
MLIGVPKEIKNHEYRVGLTPASVQEFTARGHQVVVETHAGAGIGSSDDDYRASGAAIVDSAEEVFACADMVVKVKEPQASERRLLKEDQVLFTYLHLAPDPDQTRDLIDSGATCIAYETIVDADGGLPLLAPMSQVAGRLSVQAGAQCLEKTHGGRGILLGGVPGVAPAKVTVIGGGVVGENAIQIALGMGADVSVLDRDVNVLNRLSQRYGSALKTLYSTGVTLEQSVSAADLVIGAVLVKGAAAPKLVTREMLAGMKDGSVLVDVAIDQGGCFETSRPTTHADPSYVIDGVVHYCVANMPGAVPHTSTYALNNATLPYALKLADQGYKKTLSENAGFLAGLNIYQGKVTYEAVARDLGYDYYDPERLLAA